jgi:hypothetical protein
MALKSEVKELDTGAQRCNLFDEIGRDLRVPCGLINMCADEDKPHPCAIPILSRKSQMQVNSAQDWLTAKKRQIVSATYSSTPPEPQNKTNGVYLSAAANRATVRQTLSVPSPSGWGSAPGGVTVTNNCSGCEAFSGVFSTTNTKDVLSRQALRPIGRLSGF